MPFQLERYRGPKSRFRCPSCLKENEFARYIDEEGNYLAEDVGRCNRENQCGYHRKPKDHFSETGTPFTFDQVKIVEPEPERVGYLKFDYLFETQLGPTMDDHLETNFAKGLINAFGFSEDDVMQTIVDFLWCKPFFKGHEIEWPGAVAFPLIAGDDDLREIKVFQYDPETCKRDKKKLRYMAKALTGDYDAHFPKCFFGEHQLEMKPSRPVAIAESEKTAIVCSIIFPEYIWLATGGAGMLKSLKQSGSFDKLIGREVIAFPDLGATEKWEAICGGTNIKVSKWLEKNTPEDHQKEGFDLADYLKMEVNA